MKDRNEILAKAIIEDYQSFKSKIESMKTDDWKVPNKYWEAILTNLMHKGSNPTILEARKKYPGFAKASDFSNLQKLDKANIELLFKSFVPGGQFTKQEKKILWLVNIFETINDENSLPTFAVEKTDRGELIKMLDRFKGIGCKLARNILMDLYHPQVRYKTIPIDRNWPKIGNFLNERWSDPCRHEANILMWREKYISHALIKEDWEFDRTIYQAVNHTNSKIYKTINSS